MGAACCKTLVKPLFSIAYSGYRLLAVCSSHKNKFSADHAGTCTAVEPFSKNTSEMSTSPLYNLIFHLEPFLHAIRNKDTAFYTGEV